MAGTGKCGVQGPRDWTDHEADSASGLGFLDPQNDGDRLAVAWCPGAECEHGRMHNGANPVRAG